MKILQAKDKTLSKCKPHKGFAYIYLSSCLLLNPVVSTAQMITIDPLLTAAIKTQTLTLQGSYKEREKQREAIEALQSSIAAGLYQIHRVENMVLDYMGNASGLLSNMIQFKNIGEYTVAIGEKLSDIIKDIPDNPKGAAITAVCHKQVLTTTTDIAGMADLVTNLVSTKYSLKDANSEDDKKHVNLLSAAERYNILVSVEQKLMKIYYDLQLIHYYIKTLGWRDLWYQLDRESYLKAISAGVDVNIIINKWNKLTK